MKSKHIKKSLNKYKQRRNEYVVEKSFNEISAKTGTVLKPLYIYTRGEYMYMIICLLALIILYLHSITLLRAFITTCH